MFAFYKCIQEGLIYNCKIPLKKSEELIQKYNLEFIGMVKEYWENNVRIILINNKLNFNFIQDISINYNKSKKVLIHEFNSRPCQPYNFYQVDQEEEYKLYETTNDDITIQLKEYTEYLTLTYLSNHKSKILKFNI